MLVYLFKVIVNTSEVLVDIANPTRKDKHGYYVLLWPYWLVLTLLFWGMYVGF
jgi:hypothetical protein